VLLPHRRVMLGWGECQTEHRHVQQINRDHCHDGHRYWQEFVPRRRPRSTRRDPAAAGVVTWLGDGPAKRLDPKLQLRFARSSNDKFGAGVETAHLHRGIQLPRKCAKDAHPEPRCGAELEICRKPPAFVAHRKYDRVISAAPDANPDRSTLTILIRVFCRVGYQLVSHEGNRNCPIGRYGDARLDRDLDLAARDSFVQISADVPDIGAEFEPVRTVALVNTLVRLCDRRYAIAASSRCRVNAGSFTSLAWSLSMLATMARPFLTRCVRRRPHRCAPGSLVRLMAHVTTTCVNL
jgi:hypothetical protein